MKALGGRSLSTIPRVSMGEYESQVEDEGLQGEEIDVLQSLKEDATSESTQAPANEEETTPSEPGTAI
jgi:hypothetical protein